MNINLKIKIQPQPDDITCGPTSLHSVYEYFSYSVSLEEVINSVNYLETGGTLAVHLGTDALKRGFKVSLYTYNLKVFDPSWANFSKTVLIDKIREQLKYKKGKRLLETAQAYITYLEHDGELLFANLNLGMLKSYFKQRLPVLSGICATYLYQSMREYAVSKKHMVFDDLRGEPTGHFVVLYGIKGDNVLVADPYKGNPFSGDHYYTIKAERLLNSILLGAITYDANLLIVSKKE